ncbi:MAG: Sulfatase [Parcubacteria group bacterium Gr01-1014_13]|nr:MAG: Sulfatase [Parcubacteria group bacterium Gr01-1014_13]
MLKIFFNRIKSWLPALYGLAGSFVITAGWNWYHVKYRPHLRFVLISLATWIIIYLLFVTGKKLFLYVVRKMERHPFWYTEFANSIDKLFLTVSLLFLVFFSRNELLSLVYSIVILALLFFVADRQMSRHHGASDWRIINRGLFAIILFLFTLNGILQYFGFRFYILDAQSKIYNVIVFRAWSMTMLWLIGFALGALVYMGTKKWWRYLGILIWVVAQAFVMFVWVVNAGVLYFAGLYFSPVVLQHAGESSGVVWNWLTYILLAAYLASFIAMIFVIKYVLRAHNTASKKYWKFYHYLVILIGCLVIGATSSVKSAPEFVIARSFYNHFFAKEVRIDLPPYVFGKLERFGLRYNTDKFAVAYKEKVYKESKPLLPEKFKNKKPNIILVYLESFSSRFVDVYNNNRFKDLTPGLDAFANDKNTTVFWKLYNGSTPTITGIISQLCSFLPPTGHEELEKEKKIKKVYLECLPKILKNNGYQYTGYITAVAKNFANKDTLFASMGTDEVFGTAELAKVIKGEPLAWGYSDHQMFPVMMDILEQKPEPFLMMLSTVDSHLPFDIAKDIVQFRNSKSNALNAYHTTDDAFRIFWEEFKTSKFYDNTIVIAVADHAVFPAGVTKDIFPEDAGKVNFYDENAFMMYIPDSKLPKKVDMYMSGIDMAPSVLHLLGINAPNSFEGHSIFDDRNKYPNLLGMHEFGLYINQIDAQGKRTIDYNIPSEIQCEESDYNSATSSPLTLCEYLDFYKWKRQMFEQGRFWKE